MEEWKEYRAKDFCATVTDGTHDSPKPITTGHYLITSKHLKDNRIDFSSANLISEEDYQKVILRSAVEQYDILFSMIGTIGNTVQVKQKHVDFAVKNMGIFKMGRNELKSTWLYYWLNSGYSKNYINQRLAGSTQSYMTLDSLRCFPIMYPGDKNAQLIVSVLKSLDDKIEVNRRINENLEQQAQALFKSWFVDFEPFKDQPFVESELGMIPKGWKIDNIYKYIDVVYGAPYKSALFNDEKNGMPLIRIRDLKTNSPQFYTSEILNTTEYIEAGDIVAGMDAEFTPYLWLGDKGVLNQRCCKFKGKDKWISNYFILFFVKPKLEFVQSYKTGTTVSHLGKSDIDRFKFITPPLDVVRAFSKIVNPIKEDVVNRALESRRLAELRDTLLPRLMSGELKVTDVDLVKKLTENNII